MDGLFFMLLVVLKRGSHLSAMWKIQITIILVIMK